MKEKGLLKKKANSVSKKKTRAPEVPSDEEIRELESMEIPKKLVEQVGGDNEGPPVGSRAPGKCVEKRPIVILQAEHDGGIVEYKVA